MIKQKLPSFTMMDLLTGMVIMSLIITIIFYLLGSIAGQISEYGRTRSALTAYGLLKEDINYNSQKSLFITKLPSGFEMVLPNKKITYTLENKHLIRRELRTVDTLYSNVSTLETKEVGNNIKVKNKENVNVILISLLVGNKEIKLYIYKPYTNQENINFQLFNEY